MVFKYYLDVDGNKFYPRNILKEIKGDFIIENVFCPGDVQYKFRSNEIRGYWTFGGLTIQHPFKFATENHIGRYEQDYIDFIEKNYNLFKENKGNDFRIFMEIFFEEGGQCNFEIFKRKWLKKLAKYNFALPISVYTLKKRKIRAWEKEIEAVWAAGCSENQNTE